MRKSFCFLIILGLFLFPAFVAAEGIPDEIPPGHPIFNEKNWIFEKSSDYDFVEYDGTRVVYTTFRTYRSINNEYSMQESVVFGETVTRIYYYESNNMFQKAFRLEKNGIWHGGGIIPWPKLLTDPNQKVIGVRLTMVSRDLETVMLIRDVMRK
jgi:hypothetical protein